jgi:hypothetical protein
MPGVMGKWYIGVPRLMARRDEKACRDKEWLEEEGSLDEGLARRSWAMLPQ